MVGLGRQRRRQSSSVSDRFEIALTEKLQEYFVMFFAARYCDFAVTCQVRVFDWSVIRDFAGICKDLQLVTKQALP